MAEGWGEDEIKAGIAHLQSLRAVLKRSAHKVDTRASAVSRSARTCPKIAESLKLWRPARSDGALLDLLGTVRSTKARSATNAGTPEPAKLETGHSDHGVAKLVATTYWGIGCRVCRWYCRRSTILGTNALRTASPFAHMEVRACSIQINSLRRHADSKLHRLATEALQKG